MSYNSFFPMQNKLIHLKNVLVLPSRKTSLATNSLDLRGYKGGIFDKYNSPITTISRNNDSIWPTKKYASSPKHLPNMTYGGTIFGHVGHYILETLSSIDIVCNLDDEIYFHYIGDETEKEKYYLLTKKVIKNIKFIETPCIVKDFYYQESGFKIRTKSNGNFFVSNSIKYFQNFSRKMESRNKNKKIYLSRTKYAYQNCFGEQKIEEDMKKNGFEIIYPEHLTFDKLIDSIIGSKEICGLTGSALHFSIFSPKSKLIVLNTRNRKDLTSFIEASKLVQQEIKIIQLSSKFSLPYFLGAPTLAMKFNDESNNTFLRRFYSYLCSYIYCIFRFKIKILMFSFFKKFILK